jgi:uracil phosphoribosyltransferase
MATMAMSLRVVVPPHPLIGHWLTVLRDRHTPQPLYATATAELGRWLTYEALRDWLPHRTIAVETDLAAIEGQVVDTGIPLLALPLLNTGLGLWAGAQAVLPAAQVAHPMLAASGGVHGLPAAISERAGVLLFIDQIASGQRLLSLLTALRELGVEGRRLRVVTALSASPGLKLLGEQCPELTLYTACIDAEVDAAGCVVPGIGPVAERLFGGSTLEAGVPTA